MTSPKKTEVAVSEPRVSVTEKVTRSGISLRPFYGPEAVGDLPPNPAPGEFPFVRGRLGSNRGASAWIQRELSGEGDANHSNAQLKYLIAQGQTGIDVIGDSPTQAMMDPDHPLAEKATGTQGVSLCCKDDYLALFAGLPLDTISISSSVPPIFALTGLYLAARASGVPLDKVRGSVLQVPLYAEDCGYPNHMPCDLRVRLAADVMEFCARELPRFHSFVEDTYFFSEAGLTAIEEMALGFVEIRYLIRELLRRGVDVDRFAPRIAILVNCSMDLFEEVAKLRATRRLFARMLKDEFGAKDPRSCSVNISSHTSGLSLTAEQPANNIVRGTVQALALALGGAQAIEISAFDEAYRTPSREAHLVGLRTQQILEVESGVTRVVDPLGGSYFIEALTNEIETKIRDMVVSIENKGDPANLADDGFFARFFRNTMERHARQVHSGETKLVGHNLHRISAKEDTLLRDVTQAKVSPWAGRVEAIRAFKRQRNNASVTESLRAVVAAAKDRGQNLVPAVIEATDAGATMGEVAGVLRVAYGQAYDPHGMIEPPELGA
jgi:methylmalonyl-CoA mutase N-terminal domain/subunit